MNRVLFLLALLTAGSFVAGERACAQTGTLPETSLQQLRQYEDSLIRTADSMYASMVPEDQLGYVYQFVRQLKTALSVPASYSYPFDSLKTRINIIAPEDGAFRIFNWSIAPTQTTARYYGAIQMPSEQLKLYGLVDNSAQITKGAMDSVFEGGRWFGALYYRIMPVEVDGQKAYTVFGMNAANPLSTRKVMDLLWFSKNGPVFGGKVFGVRSPDSKNQATRFILEYKKGIVAALNYNAELNAVYFDHLESDANDPGRKYTYVPTGQYDGFRWQNGEWQFVKDLIPITILQDGQNPIGGRD
jgi:hypothetical protein